MQLILAIEDQFTGRTDTAAGGFSRRRHLVRSGQRLTVGRDPAQAEIVVASDSSLSSAHFQITCQPDSCHLLDLGSRHGTVVNGQPAAQAVLAEGDHIVAGESRFVIEYLQPSVAAKNELNEGTLAVMPPSLLASLPTAVPSSSADRHADARPVPREAEFRMKLRIVQYPGADPTASQVRLFTTILPGETVVVGRLSERAEISFPGDHEMSGAHMELSCGRRDCRLRDLNSTNGTFLNGQQMHNLLLEDGDEIRAGRTYFIVEFERDRPEPGTAPMQTLPHLSLGRESRRHARRASGSFRLVNVTPFPVATMSGRLSFPEHSLTVIVRGTFALQHGTTLFPADEQTVHSGDVPFNGAEDPAAPSRYEGDFACFKPRADVLLVGHCHAPHGQPVKRLQAGLQVGATGRSVVVFGKRFWKQERGRWRTTDPEPFTSLNLCWSNSFGGEGYEDNPIGMGFRPTVRGDTQSLTPLPHIEDPDHLLRSPEDVFEAAGFGPQGKWSGRRRQQLGTFDRVWEQARFPWYPEDFSFDYFNAAPRALQVDGYLMGDECLLLSNMHPTHSQLQSQLPGIRIRCFVNPLGDEFREIPAHLDTLWIDTDNEQAVLVWRGWTSVASEDSEDIRQVFVLAQPLQEEPWSLNECHSRLLGELSRLDAQFNPVPETAVADLQSATAEDIALAGGSEEAAVGAIAAASGGNDAETAAEEQNRRFEVELKQLQKQVREAQIAAGFDPDVFDNQVRAEQARLIREWGLDGETPPAGLEQRFNAELKRLRAQVHDAQIASGQQPLPLPDAGPLELAEETPPSELVWTREKVIAHHASGGSFSGEDLGGIDLSHLDLTGADFQAAILTKASFAGSCLKQVQLTLAALSGANFSGARMEQANLEQADMTGAILHQTVLDDARVHGAILADSWLIGASLKRADCSGAFFTQADLSDAVLNAACLNSANLADAKLSRADFRFCTLADAILESATGHKARFDHSDLSRVRAAASDFTSAGFHQIEGAGSIWEKAQLKGADFSFAKLRRANFIQADLEGACLDAADLSGSRLTKAILKNAMIRAAKLFEAGLQQADLSHADLSRSCCYGAEVFGAILSETRREGVNWKMTKLADTLSAGEQTQ